MAKKEAVKFIAKKDLARALAKEFKVRTGAKITIDNANTMLTILADIVTCKLIDGEAVRLNGLVDFYAEWKEEHEAKNPATGEKIVVAGKNVAKISKSQKLMELVKTGVKPMTSDVEADVEVEGTDAE